MIKSRGIVSFALAAGIVMTMFSSVFAAPTWEVTGYLVPSNGGTAFDWKSKSGEMQIDFDSSNHYSSSTYDTFKDGYFKMSQANQKIVTFDYKGTSSSPDLSFKAPSFSDNSKMYTYVFGPNMTGTLDISDAKINQMRVQTTKPLDLVFTDYYKDDLMPTVDTNSSKELSVKLTGKTKNSVTVGSSYKDVKYSIQKCNSLTNLTISESITTVPDFACANNSNLYGVSLPSTLTSIEYGAFYKDAKLRTLGIPKSVKSIKPNAFMGSGIETINYNGTMADWAKIDIYETEPGDNNVPYISFDGLITDHEIEVICTDGSITLPVRSRNTVPSSETRGYVAQTGGKPGFEWFINGGVTIVTVGADSTNIPYTSMDKFLEKLSANGQKLTITCDKNYRGEVIFAPETTKTISNNVELIVGKNFNGEIKADFLKKVKSITVNENEIVTVNLENVDCNTLPTISENKAEYLYLEYGKFTGSTLTFPACYDGVSVTFSNKDKIEKAVFDDSIKIIKSPALEGSKNLREVTLPSSVTLIEYQVFSDCDSLKSINMPSTVKYLYDTTFSGNATFTDIYYDGYKADWEKIDLFSVTAISKPDKLLFEKGVVIHCKDGDIGEHDPEPQDTNPPSTDPPSTNPPSTNPPSTNPPSQTPSTPSNPSNQTGGGFEEFVERLYTVALNRASEPEGKAFWCEHVGNGDLNGAQCANEFLLSKEFKDRNLSNEEFLKVLYKTFFDRDAANDPDGFNFWMNCLKTQGRDSVVDCFINSEEWCNVCASYGVKSGATRAKATIASKNATAFAERLYTKCLGRDAESDGLKFWSLGLTNLELTGKQAAHEFFFSKEFNDHNFDNKELLTRMYRTFMGREPDTDGMNYWLGEMSNGMTKEQVFDCFVNSAEFTQICKDYAIDRG